MVYNGGIAGSDVGIAVNDGHGVKDSKDGYCR